MFFDAGRHREDVRIEHDVGRRKAGLVHQQAVGANADLDLAFDGFGLPSFVEGHDDRASAVAAHPTRFVEELGFAFLQADRIDQRLALDALEPSFEDSPFGAVDHEGHARDFRLGADQVEKSRHGQLRVEHALVHVDVDDVRAVANLLKRHRHRLRILPLGDEPSKLRRAGHVRALADHDEIRFRANHERLEPAEARMPFTALGRLARSQVAHGLGDGSNVIRRGSAAPPGDVDHAVGRKPADELGHLFGRLIVSAKRVRQASVGVAMDVAVGDAGELLQEGSHLRSTQRAVDPNGERTRVLDGDVKRLDRLTRQGSAALVDDGDGEDERKPDALLFRHVVDCAKRGLRIERVENRLDEEQVATAVDQPTNLLRVGFACVVERERSKARVVDVGAQAQGLVERPDGAGHEAGAIRATRRGLFRDARGRDVEVVDDVLEVVVCLGKRVRVERIRLDDVGARVQILLVNSANHVGASQDQQVVVALEALRVIDEAIAPKVGFLEPGTLDHRAHRAIEKDDALCKKGLKPLCGRVVAHIRIR